MNGEFFGNVDQALVIKFGLRVGLEIDDTVLRRIIREDEILKAKNYAFDLLVRRSYSRKELQNKLTKRGFTEEAITTTMETLERLEYIKDEKYARDWVDSRRRLKPKGKKALRMELMQKGIDKGTIERILSEIDDSEEYTMALELAQKQMNRYKSIDKYVARRRLYNFLTSRGFDYETVNSVMSNVMDKG